MSGHSKWSKVKHQKESTDAQKSVAFTKVSRAITCAIQAGGGITDPDKNYHLRLAIEQARQVNMPKEHIHRIIANATHGGEAVLEAMYEAYGPYGVAFIIETATDNANRTVSVLKKIFDHAGGSLATPGAVQYLFHKRGLIIVSGITDSSLIYTVSIEAGAQDVQERRGEYRVYTSHDRLCSLKHAFEENHIPIRIAKIVWEPNQEGRALTAEQQAVISDLCRCLEACGDVKHVYTNAG